MHYHKKFGGETYRIFDRICDTRKEAQSVASLLRNDGYNVRIVPGPPGYPKYNFYVKWRNKK